ncbi:anthrone oxygenase family protein [Arthrobacter pigmenti]
MRKVQFTALTLSGLLAGNELGTLIGLHPAVKSLPLDQQIPSEQALTGCLMKIMPVYTSSALIAVSAAAVDRAGRRGFRPALGAAVAIAAMLAVTAAGNIPLNKRTMAYSANGGEADWAAMRRQWEQLHAVRVLLDLTAFGALAAAAFTEERHHLVDSRTS